MGLFGAFLEGVGVQGGRGIAEGVEKQQCVRLSWVS